MAEHLPGRRPVAGAAAVLVAVSVWGAVAVVARLVDQIDGLVLGFHRLWIGALVTLVVFYGTGRRLSRAALWMSAPGGIAFAADIVLFYSALKHTTVANATVVGALQPALVLLVAGRLFGESVTPRIVAWSGAAIAGVAIVVYGSSGAPVWSPAGDLLAVGSLLAWTGYFVASKRVRPQLPPFDYLTAMLVVASLVVAPVALLSGQRLDPGGAGEWWWIVLLAVGSGGFGHLLLNWAHEHVDLSVMSLLTLAVPVVAVISAAIFLDESIGWVQALGMAVVVVALGAVTLQTTRVEPAPPTDRAGSTATAS
jgi:drug/metabolite transporter (DMT)-like permease